jgi:hypothetical protein
MPGRAVPLPTPRCRCAAGPGHFTGAQRRRYGADSVPADAAADDAP